MADKKQTKLKSLEELRKLDKKGLVSKIAELKAQLVDQQRSHHAQELPSPAVIGKTRKEIAQALTLLNQQVTSEQQPAEKADEKEEEK